MFKINLGTYSLMSSNSFESDWDWVVFENKYGHTQFRTDDKHKATKFTLFQTIKKLVQVRLNNRYRKRYKIAINISSI